MWNAQTLGRSGPAQPCAAWTEAAGIQKPHFSAATIPEWNNNLGSFLTPINSLDWLLSYLLKQSPFCNSHTVRQQISHSHSVNSERQRLSALSPPPNALLARGTGSFTSADYGPTESPTSTSIPLTPATLSHRQHSRTRTHKPKPHHTHHPDNRLRHHFKRRHPFPALHTPPGLLCCPCLSLGRFYRHPRTCVSPAGA